MAWPIWLKAENNSKAWSHQFCTNFETWARKMHLAEILSETNEKTKDGPNEHCKDSVSDQ